MEAPNVENRLISNRLEGVSASGIRRFFDLAASLEGVISLGVGEPDRPTPWHIREAAIYSLEKGYTTYTSNQGIAPLRQEISRHLEADYGISYDPETEILVTVGVSQGMDLAMRALVNTGDEVMVPDPAYVAYVPCILLAGGRPIPLPTSEEAGFLLSPDTVSHSITPQSKAMFFGYPANPTGAVMPREQLQAVAGLVEKHNLIAVSDEIYAGLTYGVEHTCFASLPGMKERTVLLGGFSKYYAMTGWRLGYACGPAEIIEAMTRIHQYTMMCAPTMAQMAALEAFRNGEEAAQEMAADYNHRRRTFVKGLNSIGLHCLEPQGAFYAFPSVRATGLSSVDFAEKLLVEERVAVVPGSAFGDCGEGYVRCCYAVAPQDLDEALRRMGHLMAGYHNR
jgi:aminotransferase